MADSRIDGLDDLGLVQLESLKASLKFAVDAGTLTDAEALLLTDLLISTAIADLDPVDFRAMTPAGFKATTAAEDRLGVVELADDADIANRANPTVLRAEKLDQIIDALTLNTYTINNGNYATYIDEGSGNITLSGITIRVKKVGNLVFMNGSVTGSVTNQQKMSLYFKSPIPLPANNGKQHFGISVEISAAPRPLGGSIEYISASSARVYAGGASGVLNGSLTYYISACYSIT